MKQVLHRNWRLHSTTQVEAAARDVSCVGFETADWTRFDGPSTVLAALVRAGVYPDPRIGLNNLQIPDASDAFNAGHGLGKYSHLPGIENPWKDPYWYRIEFDAPAECGVRQWLVFKALNYRGEVWLNGERLATREEIVGSLVRHRIDVTGVARLGARNCLAMKIWGPDHPGMPEDQHVPLESLRVWNRDPDSSIMRDVTINIAATGYDCAPEVRDRLMGLWDDVEFEWAGPVALRHPFVRSKLPLPRTESARLTVSFDAINTTDAPVDTEIRATIPGVGAWTRTMSLRPSETRTVTWTSEDVPELHVQNPALWWPADHGDQPLYTLELEAQAESQTSDAASTRFGIREVEKVLHDVDGAPQLRVTINGRKIYSRGGYLQFDTLMDHAVMTQERFETEIAYLKAAGLNTVSYEDWPSPPDRLLDLFDEHGILLWHCYFQCHWLIRDDFPEDHDLLGASAVDITLRVRNHPCVVAYLCMNEGTTCEDQYTRWRKAVTELDGTRILIPCGYCDANNLDYAPEWIQPDWPVGANDGAPKSYTWKRPSWYFDMVREDPTWPFKIESCSASVPPVESLRQFMPDLDEHDGAGPFPLTKTWAYHGANTYYADFDAALRRRYGDPASLRDYCWKAHLMTAVQHRAMFEAVQHRKWDRTSGFLQWKLNSCWPSIQWQIFDYFLRPMVSLYWIRRACGPLHAQLNPVDRTISVVNNTQEDAARLQLTAKVFSFGLEELHGETAAVDVAADAYASTMVLPEWPIADQIYFVRLTLEDADLVPLDTNLYWVSPLGETENDAGCFARLGELPAAKLDSVLEVHTGKVHSRIHNVGDHVALLAHRRLVYAADRREVLPILWSDDYICLMPGEVHEAWAEVPDEAAGQALALELDAWQGVEGQPEL